MSSPAPAYTSSSRIAEIFDPMPWQLKALLQFVFARLPFGEHLNYLAQRLNGSFTTDAQLSALISQINNARKLNQRFPIEGATAVEIGTGWLGAGIVTLAVFGARHIYSFDNQPHLRLLGRLIETAQQNIDRVSSASGIGRHIIEDRLKSLHVTYVAPGDASHTNLPNDSVDLIYSYGVLEHVPVDVLKAIGVESKRILKPTGRTFHYIGMHDHFAGGVRFLQYPDWVYDALFCHRVHYHNRLRLSDYLALFDAIDLKAEWIETRTVESTPRITKRFRDRSLTDLVTTALYVDLTKRAP